ncbi:MAG: cysteine desulfurase family protein [bacterium]
MKRIYLDYASLTPIDKEVKKVMMKYMGEEFGNPSSIHAVGVEAKNELGRSRKICSEFLNAHIDEVFFTGSGTEANNLAIMGTVEANFRKGIKYENQHVVVSSIEHSSVLECAKVLSAKGVSMTYLNVDKNGLVLLGELKSALNEKTVLVSVMMVNNEIGVVEPVRDIAKIIRDYNKKEKTNSEQSENVHNGKVIFHTDASQSALYLELNVETLGVDLLTIDSHKVNGPRGIALLYKKRGVEIDAVIHGGGQESGLRSGTENLPAICGFARALEMAKATAKRKKESERIALLRNEFEAKVLRAFPKSFAVSSSVERIPHISNIVFPNIDNEYFVLCLDALGIYCSTKSSCLRDEDESYVLKAIGLEKSARGGSVRFSFGKWNKRSELPYILKMILKCYNLGHGTLK